MAGALAYPVRSPRWELSYRGVNITAKISRMALAITFTQHVGGSSNEIEVELEDRDRRWQGKWFPARGDLMNLQIGYGGEKLLPCGDFQVDELELKGPPDTFHIRGMSAFITPAMRTPASNGYENQTLTQIATTIASKYGMTVVGAPDQINIQFKRKTQNRETDLAFLHRIARDHNYDFNIHDNQIVFFSRPALEKRAPVYVVTRSNVERFEFKSKSHNVYKAATVSYQEPNSKKLITRTVNADPPVATGDTYVLQERAENGQDALLKAQAALHRMNMLTATGNLTLPGTTVLAAGNNITVSGFGAHDGKYMIEKAVHKLDRANGYSTEIEIRSVNL